MSENKYTTADLKAMQAWSFDRKIAVTPEFICEQLAECFDTPCNMSPFEEELHDTEEKDEWCEKFCGKATAADCWMRYFQLKYNEKEKEAND